MWQIRWEFVLFIRKILEIRRKFTWGEARFPPYTNESLAIRYPPMLLQSRNCRIGAKILIDILICKIIY